MGLVEDTWAAFLRFWRRLRPAWFRDNPGDEAPFADEFWEGPGHRRRKSDQDEWRRDLAAYLSPSGSSERRLADNISVYSCTEINNLYASHPIRIPRDSVRLQVLDAPPRSPLTRYPKFHIGLEHWGRDYKLRARLPWVEFPILNNRTGRVWTRGDPPGPVRAVYNDTDRTKFDIIYHDPLAKRGGEFKKAALRTRSGGRGGGSRRQARSAEEEARLEEARWEEARREVHRREAARREARREAQEERSRNAARARPVRGFAVLAALASH